MKKIFLLSTLMLLSLAMAAQNKKLFKCELFSLEYPSTFEKMPIVKAPHMHLKIANSKYCFTASYWDYGIDPNFDIWDDELYEHYKGVPIQGDLQKVEKVVVTTKLAKQRSIRMKSVLKGSGVALYNVTYLMIHNGHLLVFCIYSTNADLFTQYGLRYQENLFKGLAFSKSSTSLMSESSFYRKVLEAVKGLNAQCPIRGDEATTYTSVILSGKTLCIKTVIDDDYIDLLDLDYVKSCWCENFKNALPKEFFEYLKAYEFSMSYIVYNEEDTLYKVIKITPQEILKYYD